MDSVREVCLHSVATALVHDGGMVATLSERCRSRFEGLTRDLRGSIGLWVEGLGLFWFMCCLWLLRGFVGSRIESF